MNAERRGVPYKLNGMDGRGGECETQPEPAGNKAPLLPSAIQRKHPKPRRRNESEEPRLQNISAG